MARTRAYKVTGDQEIALRLFVDWLRQDGASEATRMIYEGHVRHVMAKTPLHASELERAEVVSQIQGRFTFRTRQQFTSALHRFERFREQMREVLPKTLAVEGDEPIFGPGGYSRLRDALFDALPVQPCYPLILRWLAFYGADEFARPAPRAGSRIEDVVSARWESFVEAGDRHALATANGARIEFRVDPRRFGGIKRLLSVLWLWGGWIVEDVERGAILMPAEPRSFDRTVHCDLLRVQTLESAHLFAPDRLPEIDFDLSSRRDPAVAYPAA